MRRWRKGWPDFLKWNSAPPSWKPGASWDGLWLFDNYESVLQGLQENDVEAGRIHRLIADLANGGANLLLTSHEQPAGLRNERLFPESAHLAGLNEAAGVELFFQHSVRAKAEARRTPGVCP